MTKKKKILLVAGLAAVMSIGLASCGGGGNDKSSEPATSQNNTIYVEDIVLEATSLEVNINETVKISASVSPSNATTKGLNYASANEGIAKVSSTGVVTGVAAGETTITVTSKGTKADGTTKVEKTVRIKVNEVFVTDMTLANNSVTLEINGTEQIQATVLPENASIKGLEYSSDAPAVATVSDGGLIKGVGIGSANITVKTKGKKADGSVITKTVAVNVVATAISELRIAQPSVTFNLEEGQPAPTAKIEYEILPSNATEKGVTFQSSDTGVVTVSTDGTMTAVAMGEATVTVTTVAQDAQGNHLTGTVSVRVISQINVIEFQNSDGTLLQGYTADEIQVGETPDYIGEIPGRASDEENIYIFRGFDKDIVPYAVSNEKIIYKAVYEATKSTPRNVTLTKATVEGEEHPIFTVTGESKGVDTETIRERAWLAFQCHTGHSWGTSYSPAQSPIINADGSWVMQWDLTADADQYTRFQDGYRYMGKYVWDRDTAGSPVDLKILHREDHKRYRHDATTGEIIEDNQIGNDWDGILPDDYVATGHYGNDGEGNPLSSTNLSEEKRQQFANAAGAPTWVGLGVSYEPAKFEIGKKTWELFTNDDVWYLPSIQVTDAATAKQIHIVEEEGKAYYTVSGVLSRENAMSEAELMLASMDFEHNGEVDGGSGYVGATGKSGPGVTPEKVTISGTDFSLYFRVDNIDGIKNNDINGYYPHFSLADVSTSGERSDFPSSVARTSGESIVVDGYTYKIVSASGNGAGYWGNPGLQIEKYVAPIEEVSSIGYSASGSTVNFSITGKINGLSGAAVLHVGDSTSNINIGADGSFSGTVDVSSMTRTDSSSYSSSRNRDIYVEANEENHRLTSSGINHDAEIKEISTSVSGDNGCNYVLVNKDGYIKASTVASSFTSSVLQLREKDGRAMLRVVGTFMTQWSSNGLKLAINNLGTDENFAVPVTPGANNALDFEIDVTNYVNAASGVANGNRIYLVNEQGRTIRNADGRGLNWTWMSDWSLGINDYSVHVGNKTYTISTSNNATLTVVEDAAE